MMQFLPACRFHRLLLTRLAVALLVGSLLPALTSVLAAQPVTRADVSDPDYPVVGEYTGRLRTDDGRKNFGLQVAARGEDRFRAVLLTGGLPGGGWDGSPRIVLEGQREGSGVRLVAQDRAWEAWWFGPGGERFYFSDQAASRPLGSLGKIERTSPTLGWRPPADAIMLFRGELTEYLQGAEVDSHGWLKPGFTTAQPVTDFFLHVEFQTPWEPAKNSQGRGNSGVYIQRRYEVQILDSFGLEEIINGCGSLYRQVPPAVNMSLPPLTWQTYDIRFRAARWSPDGEKLEAARLTVRHNGVTLHDWREIATKTGAGRPEAPQPLPILFQDHSNPVRFRNLWLIRYDDKTPGEPETLTTASSPAER